MKLFTSKQIKEIDNYTIQNEPISSIDLMERAANRLFEWFIGNIDKRREVVIFTGPGNNGGDGLALARMLGKLSYHVGVCNLGFTDKRSEDWRINYSRLTGIDNVTFSEAKTIQDIPLLTRENVIVDAIFGTGLDRPVKGFPAEVISIINNSGAMVVSVDTPSGLFSENNSGNNFEAVIKADITLSIQFPKLSFMLSDNQDYVGEYVALSIGLHPRIIREMETNIFTIDDALLRTVIKKRGKFDHKGKFGHGLMVAGSCGKLGAAILSSSAALRTGIGLLTVHLPGNSADVIHSSLPEAMVQCDQSEILISDISHVNDFDAVGIGPGIGTKPNTHKAVSKFLDNFKGGSVIDADALNIIAADKMLIKKLHKKCILTPHPGEFERLAGKTPDSYARLQKQIEFSVNQNCIVVLKGGHTSVTIPDGRTWFNTTGNPGMATAGSGDVLTGMIMSLLAQGYSTADAALAGVFLHGRAGDIASEKIGYDSLIASDIINNIGNAFKSILQV